MRVHIVNYEEGQNNGILTKFAVKLHEELKKLGTDTSIGARPDVNADINHHVNYLPYHYENSPKSINTLMVTHIWEGYKLTAIKEGMQTADMGICMSSQMPKWLNRQGILRKKLTYVLPAHDRKPRRHQVVAILTNVYPDGCKRAEMFTELCKTIDYNKFAFRIMGSGWTDILVPLVADGLQVDYFEKFEADISQKILDSSDYALYFGEDEGSMGLLDAVNAGVKVIGTPQGFHLDMKLDYSFTTQDELNEIFMYLNPNRVEGWTWDKYAANHLKIWKEIYAKRK
jgi:hypothetical protein